MHVHNACMHMYTLHVQNAGIHNACDLLSLLYIAGHNNSNMTLEWPVNPDKYRVSHTAFADEIPQNSIMIGWRMDALVKLCQHTQLAVDLCSYIYSAYFLMCLQGGTYTGFHLEKKLFFGGGMEAGHGGQNT